MVLATWLRISAMGLPLIGILIIWCWGDKFRRVQGWLALSIFGLVGLVALTLFLLNRQYACILSSGRQNCLFDGLATLSLFGLSLVLAKASLLGQSHNDADRAGDERLRLLLVSAWAGMGLTENLLVLLIALNLFLFVVHRWLKRRGLTWRILALRDDYQDRPK